MVKKMKTSKRASKNRDIALSVKESAQDIWLAGLGAFAKAQEEGGKVFKALVREGSSMQKRSVQITEEKFGEVSSKVSQVAGNLQKQASGTWDKLEGVFEERVERALSRLNVPTRKDLDELNARLDALSARPAPSKTSGAKRAKKSIAKKPFAAKRTRKTTARD